MDDFNNLPEHLRPNVDGTLHIYIDTENGFPGSEVGLDGKLEHPCHSWDDAEKLMSKLKAIDPESEIVIKEI